MKNAHKIDVKYPIPRWIYYAIFTVSGFSGLIYESIWSHYLKLFLGHAALAQSLVLIIFMGGMALGAWVASKYSERLKSPILIYVIVEATIGVAALLFHGVFSSVIDVFYNSLLPAVNIPLLASSLKWIAASMLIMPQSILLGMTFPLMTAGIIRRYPDSPGGSIAMLYFTNSIGAAIGVLTSGFILIELVGLPGTILTAGLTNLGLALFVWVMLKTDTVESTEPLPSSMQSNEQLEVAKLFLLAAAITGTASFIYEVSWIRMLSMVLGSTTYAFELMLSAFITGLAFGGLWIKKRIDSIASPIKFLGHVQIIMGIFALLTIPVYVESYDWMTSIMQALNKNDAGYTFFTASSHVIALVVMLPATFFAGMTLPLLTHILLKNGAGEKSIGRIYSANTLGAIVGVLFAMHIGLPYFGLKLSVVFAAVLDIALGIYLVNKALGNLKTVKAFSTAIASGVVLCYVVYFCPLSTSLLASGVYRYAGTSDNFMSNRQVIFHRDGTTASVSVYVTTLGNQAIATNGKPDAAINMMTHPDNKLPSGDEITMVLAGAIPFAYHPSATKIANIGLGSGLTTHTLLAKDSVDVVDTVEIEKSMVMGSRYFGPFVERTHNDPRSVIHIDDAKTFFSTQNKQYDVIITEPSNPWVSGVSSLFTHEFYQTIKNYVTDDGLFVQWIHLYEFDNDLLLSILKAIDRNFSDYVVYNTDSINILLILKKNGKLAPPDWSQVFEGELKKDLARQNVHNKDDLIVRRIASRKNLRDIQSFFSVITNSDYYPYVDLNAVKARFKRLNSDMFQSWSRAPLPILEMLNGYTLNFDNVTASEYLTRSHDIQGASLIYAYLTAPSVEPDEELQANVLESLSILRYTAETCSFKQYAKAWQNTVQLIAFNALPFLNSEKAVKLVNVVKNSRCPASSRSAFQNDTLAYFTAVAARDSTQMTQTGLQLLSHRQEIDPDIQGYIISGVLLGYLIDKQYLAADKFLLAQQEVDEEYKPNFGQAFYQKLLSATLSSAFLQGSD